MLRFTDVRGYAIMPEPSVNINTTDNSTVLVPGPTGRYAFIAVLSYDIIADGATNVSLQDSLGNVYTGPQSLAADGNGLVKNQPDNGYCFVLPKGAALLLVQDGGAQLGGSLQFTTVNR